MRANVTCKNYRKTMDSIIDLDKFSLDLTGKPDRGHESFTLQGEVVEEPLKIEVKFTRVAELP